MFIPLLSAEPLPTTKNLIVLLLCRLRRAGLLNSLSLMLVLLHYHLLNPVITLLPTYSKTSSPLFIPLLSIVLFVIFTKRSLLSISATDTPTLPSGGRFCTQTRASTIYSAQMAKNIFGGSWERPWTLAIHQRWSNTEVGT